MRSQQRYICPRRDRLGCIRSADYVGDGQGTKEILDAHVEVLPVVAVIYSHSHGDHFGGVRGLVSIEDVAAGKVEIIAPRDFMDFAVAENIYAGNAM